MSIDTAILEKKTMQKSHILTKVSLALLLLLLTLVNVFAVHAQDEPPPPDIIIEPPIWEIGGLKIDYQRVDVSIDNQIATTRIDQLFVNESDRMLEGTYFFPLPVGATVTELTMWVDGVPIESKILRKEEAREIYDRIVAQLRDPALLEYIGQDAIQANVFPIPARDERRIEIEYQQVLPADGGLIHYVFPQSTKLYTNQPLEEQSIRVEIQSQEAIRSLYSPTHRVAENRDGEFRAVVGYEDSNVTADRDFELYYSVSPEDIGVNVISFKEPGQDGFFMLLAAPSVEVDEDEIVAKDVILVLDTSGSMEGEKMSQAKEAARLIIEQLNPVDRFNIVTFSTGVRTYLPELVPAGDAGNVDQFINSIEALGGTNISQALLEAVDQVDSDRPATIIFMTDGLATEGIVDTDELIDAVDKETPRNVRLFAFGVGNDVDTFLLDEITSNHRGTTSYVRPFERIDEEMEAFYTKISTPVLADIEIDYDGIFVEQLYPDELPDLFAGTQLVLVGRYREGGPATITLTGDVNGEAQSFVYEDNLFRTSGGDDFIPRLWATRAIGNLLNEIRLRGETPELVESIVSLSIRYGIITPYTSYLIEEDDIFTQLGREQIVEEVIIESEMENAEGGFSGADAVEEAEALSDLSAAEAPAEVEVTRVVTEGVVDDDGQAGEAVAANVQPIQIIGSKTFVIRDGVWIDTAYDNSMITEQVGFAGDSYFELLSAAPELGQYLALGERVIVVYDAIAYEIVPGETAGEITLPDPAEQPEQIETDSGSTESTQPESQTDLSTAPEEIVEQETSSTVDESVSENPDQDIVVDEESGQPFNLIVLIGIAAVLIGGLALGIRFLRR